jgi:hypothetical protein
MPHVEDKAAGVRFASIKRMVDFRRIAADTAFTCGGRSSGRPRLEADQNQSEIRKP